VHLLDINILLARVDRSHPHHNQAKMKMNALVEWATCPLTENGFLRILGHPKYPGMGPGTPEGASVALRGLISAIPGHRFLPDDISILKFFKSLEGMASSHLTDVYLLALAMNHKAKFLTFDRKVDPSVIPGGGAYFEVLA